MPDPDLVHAATLIRLDVATNALAVLIRHIDFLRDVVADLSPAARAEFEAALANAGGDLTSSEAIEIGHVAQAVAWGQSADVPPSIASQRLTDDMMMRRLLEQTRQ